MRPRQLRRNTAVALALSLVLALAVAPAAASGAALSGRVVDGDGITPRSGAVVALYQEAAAKTAYRSAPTEADGSFKIDTVPPGTYAVLVETAEGTFLADADMPLAEGANRPVSLALSPLAPAVADDSSGSTTIHPRKMPRWAQGLLAGTISVAALFVIDEVVKDSEETSSDF